MSAIKNFRLSMYNCMIIKVQVVYVKPELFT